MHHKHSSLQFHTRLVSPIYCNFEKFFHYLTIFRCLNVRKSQFLHKHLIANKGTFSYSFLSWTQTNKTFCRTNALHEPNAILTLTRCHYIIKNQLKYFITLKSSDSKYEIELWRRKTHTKLTVYQYNGYTLSTKLIEHQRKNYH